MKRNEKTAVKQVFSTLSPSQFFRMFPPLLDSNPPRFFFVGVVVCTCALHASNSSSVILPFPEKVAAFVEVGSVGVVASDEGVAQGLSDALLLLLLSRFGGVEE